MPELYADKITIREEIFEAGANNWVFNQFAGLIPPSYNINLGKMTSWNYDPFDALYVGLQSGTSEITEACLNMLPTSKAIIPSGRTLDIRDQGFKSDDKINIDQFIDLNYKSMTAKINRMRASRIYDIPRAILGYFGLVSVKKLVESVFEPSGVSFELPETPENSGTGTEHESVTKKLHGLVSTNNLLKAGAIALPISQWLISCKVQNLYIDGFIKNFELLFSLKQGVYNKPYAKRCLEKLEAKVNRFGFGRKFAKRLKALAEKI